MLIINDPNVFVKPDEQRKLACSAMAKKRLMLIERKP